MKALFTFAFLFQFLAGCTGGSSSDSSAQDSKPSSNTPVTETIEVTYHLANDIQTFDAIRSVLEKELNAKFVAANLDQNPELIFYSTPSDRWELFIEEGRPGITQVIKDNDRVQLVLLRWGTNLSSFQNTPPGALAQLIYHTDGLIDGQNDALNKIGEYLRN